VGSNPLSAVDPTGLLAEAGGGGDDSGGGAGGAFVAFFVFIGDEIASAFGGGPSLSLPTFSTTVFALNPIQMVPSSDSSTLVAFGGVPRVYNLGLLFFAQATAKSSSKATKPPCAVSPRDKHYLDLYYNPVSQAAENYNVSPALVLGLGIESGFASVGTYLATGDAFGMTGGSTTNMTKSASPTQNVNQFFGSYGNQIRGAANNVQVFLNGLEGKNPLGQPVKGWKAFNSAHAATWWPMAKSGIAQMQREIPIYLSNCK
jgi:hypothetical protein